MKAKARVLLGFALLAIGACDLIDHLPPPPYGGGGGGGAGGQALIIDHQPLTGFTVYEADARRNDPRAGRTLLRLSAGGRRCRPAAGSRGA